VTGGEPQPNGPPISHEAMYRGSAPACCARDLPGLFNILAHVCRRAGLCRLPDLIACCSERYECLALGGPPSAPSC